MEAIQVTPIRIVVALYPIIETKVVIDVTYIALVVLIKGITLMAKSTKHVVGEHV